MTSVTRRAVRTTAAIAGIAALGTGLAGAAAALPVVDDLPLADALPAGAGDAVPTVLGAIPAVQEGAGAGLPALGNVELPTIAAPMGLAGLPELPDPAGLAALPGLPELPDASGVLATVEGAAGPALAPVVSSDITPSSLVPSLPLSDLPAVGMSDAPALATALVAQATQGQISGSALTM